MTLEVRSNGKGHWYLIDGHKVLGVTTARKAGLPAPAISNWMVNTTIDYAIDHWDELSREPISERVKKLHKARFIQRDAAARRGTEVHKLAESLIHGEQVEVPEEIAGHVESYVDFLDKWQVAPVLVETPVGSRRWQYAGRFDAVADLVGTSCSHCLSSRPNRRGCRYIFDIKTNRSGIFRETALQLAAYRYAEFYLDADGTEQPMSELGICGALAVWVRSDGYDVYRVGADETQHNKFLHVLTVARWAQSEESLISDALSLPSTAVTA